MAGAFTERHYQVLRMRLSGGFDNKGIAARLGISVKIVELLRTELDKRFDFEGSGAQEAVKELVEEAQLGGDYVVASLPSVHPSSQRRIV